MRRKDTWLDWGARACVLALLAAPVSNPDLYWHLNAAGRMLAEGRLPRDEAFSFTQVGVRWVDFEWLFQLTALGAEAAAGAWGLWALKAALWTMAAALVEAAGRFSGGAPRGRLLLVLWCAASLGRAELKPELFSLAFFLALFLLLDAAQRGTLPEASPVRAAAGAALIFAFWANLHAGWPVGLGLIAAFLAFGARKARPVCAAALAAGAAATLVNPYGWGVWTVLAEHLRFSPLLARKILEWGPLTPRNPYHVPQLALLAGAAAASAAAAFAGLPQRRPLAAAAAVLGAAGLLQARHMTYAAPLAGLLLLEAAASLSEALPRPERWRRAGAVLAGLGAAAFLILRGAALAWPLRPVDRTFQPVAAADFVAGEAAEFRRRRVYNEWGWGGYLARRFPAEFRIFFDGRYLFHPLLAASAEAERSPEAWEAFLDRWSVDWVLIADRREADPYFSRRGWALVHRDGTARVLVRRSAFAPAWVARFEAPAAR